MIHLYIASIEKLMDEKIYFEKLSHISAERCEKIHACKMQKDKNRSLAAGLLVEYAWTTYLRENGEKMEPLQIIVGQNGKPVCGNREDFYFNLSHSGEYVICAVSRDAVGADIQQVKEVQLNIAKRFFLPGECEALERSDDPNQLFCQMWAMKESYVKYTGKGIKQRLDSFSVNAKTGMIKDMALQKHFYVTFFEEIPGYQIAVCTAEKQEMCIQKYDFTSGK